MTSGGDIATPPPTPTDEEEETHKKVAETVGSSADEEEEEEDSLLCCTFNQDGGCMAVGTEDGFRICNVSPFQETFRRRHPIGSQCGIRLMEMLFRCNLLALVGCEFPNKVYIWDDHLGRPIGELSFRQTVLRVKLCRDRICIALRDRIYVYNFGNLQLLDTIVTGENLEGLLCISTQQNWVLACPSGVTKGQVRVELYSHRKSNLIQAHTHKLAAMALTADGALLATASDRGTVIRLFDTTSSTHTPLQEFRRGVERATISCLSFSHDKSWLASSGMDRGSVHIYPIHTKNETLPKKSKSKWSSKLWGGGSNGMESSHTVIRGIPHPQQCAFVPDKPNTIAVAGLDEHGNGCLLLAHFSSEEPQRVAYHRFFKQTTPTPPKKQTKEEKVYLQEEQEQDLATLQQASHPLETIIFDDADGFVNIETTTDNKDAATPAKTTTTEPATDLTIETEPSAAKIIHDTTNHTNTNDTIHKQTTTTTEQTMEPSPTLKKDQTTEDTK